MEELLGCHFTVAICEHIIILFIYQDSGLQKLVIQRNLLLMFKHNIGVVPIPIASLFTKTSEINGYNIRHCSSLHPTIGKSEATYRTFSYHAILIWKYLSKLICTNVTLASFKKRSIEYLQTHLIPYRTVR